MFFAPANFKITCNVVLFFFMKGVLKVRKRVTLMIITVSAIFGHLAPRCNSTRRRTNNQPQFQSRHICYRSHHIMFNSAVNPFAYALINQRFREKMKPLLCYSSILSELRSSTNLQSHSIELMNSSITQPRQ